MGHKIEACSKREFIVAKSNSPELGDNYPTDFSSVTRSSGLLISEGECVINEKPCAKIASTTRNEAEIPESLIHCLDIQADGILKLATNYVLRKKIRKPPINEITKEHITIGERH